jgi:hypothetical protein
MGNPRAHEDFLFQRNVILLRTANPINRWWIALYFLTIIGFGTVGAVAFAMPDIIDRVNAQEEVQ